MSTTYQFDPSYNVMNHSGDTYSNKVFAFQGTGGFNISQQFQTIQRLPETQINIFDTTGSVQVVIPVGVLNAKLGLVKTARNVSGGFLMDVTDSCGNYYDSSNNVLTTDSITITANEFKMNIPSASSIISVGKLSTIYSDFANYVASYFNLASPTTSSSSGFSTLFVNDYGFNPNGGVFDASALYHIIKGNGVIDVSNHSGINLLAGSITLSNITKLLRYAVDVNPFGNRDPINGTTAIDPSNVANYGVSDGFLAGDIIFVPNNGFAMQLNANINYQSTINNYIQNNPNQTPVIGYLDTSLNGLSGFHTTTTNTSSYIGRQMSTPLLIRLVDTAVAVAQSMPTQDISAGSTTLNLVSYTGLTIGMTIVVGTGANAETRTIVGFGSVILDRPLTQSYTAAETVITAYMPNKLLDASGITVTTSTGTGNGIGAGIYGNVIFSFIGKYSYLAIYRDGSLLQNNITDTSYTDSGALAGTTVNYSIVPSDSFHNIGQTQTVSVIVPYNATMTSLSVASETTNQIQLAFSGYYSYVSISRADVGLLNAKVTGTTYLDTLNILPDHSYNYVVTPYNIQEVAGTVIARLQDYSLPLLNDVQVVNVTATTIDLSFNGSYAYVKIQREPSGGVFADISNTVYGSYFHDTGLSGSTTYIYNVIPYNHENEVGTSIWVSRTTQSVMNVSNLLAGYFFETNTASTTLDTKTNTYSNITSGSISNIAKYGNYSMKISVSNSLTYKTIVFPTNVAGNGFSIACWIYSTSPMDNYIYVVGGFCPSINIIGQNIHCYLSTTDWRTYMNYTFNLNTWYHVVFTYTWTGVGYTAIPTVYVNGGTLNASGGGAKTVVNGFTTTLPATLVTGANGTMYSSNQANTPTYVDSLFIYNYPLSDTNVYDLYTNGFL